MEKLERLSKFSDAHFKRLVGVKRSTFEVMFKEYKSYLDEKSAKAGIGGRKKSLLPEDQLLLMLSYYREYRTLAHIGFDYGVSESTASRIVSEVEHVLIKSGKFSLPSKRALLGNDLELDIVVIDATEVPIQRPKKTRESTIQGRKNSTP